jgi:multidrug resistance efflux pump
VFSSYTSTTDETRYITALAKKGSVIASVTGSGQVSASNQIDLKAKASGEVTYLPVKNGQDVKAGALIAQLDAREAQKTVRDAEANLQSAKISLEKLKQPTEKLSIIQAQNTLARAKESKQNAEDDLQKAYEDGFNAITNAFLDLPSVMTGLQDILYSSIAGLSPSGQWNIDYYANAVEKYSDQINQYKTTTATRYQTARTAYDKSFQDYKST